MAWSVTGNIKGPKGDTGDVGSTGPAGSTVLIQGDVAAYANLPGGLGSGDKGKAWVVLADGKLYEWNGSSFPASGSGASFVGPQGDTGPAGADGAGIEIAGTVANYAALPTNLTSADAGKAYMVTDGGAYADGLLYIWDGNAFPAEGSGVAFQGPAGPTGPKGDTGDTGLQGPQGDPGTAGSDGARGSVWFTGAGSPSGVTGSVAGDMYLDTTNGDVYQLS
jgi:hypothetical protein